VYEWRLEQEAALRASKGVGMTDQQVVNFVNGCKQSIPASPLKPACKNLHTNRTRTDYPAYELFTDKLRSGIFECDKGRQLRLIVGKDRRVKHSQIL